MPPSVHCILAGDTSARNIQKVYWRGCYIIAAAGAELHSRNVILKQKRKMCARAARAYKALETESEHRRANCLAEHLNDGLVYLLPVIKPLCFPDASTSPHWLAAQTLHLLSYSAIKFVSIGCWACISERQRSLSSLTRECWVTMSFGDLLLSAVCMACT